KPQSAQQLPPIGGGGGEDESRRRNHDGRVRQDYSISIRASSGVTEAPLATCPATTLPAMGACTSVSIFMASVISTGSPAFTSSPTLTSTSTMVPGMEVVTWPGSVARGRELAPF